MFVASKPVKLSNGLFGSGGARPAETPIYFGVNDRKIFASNAHRKSLNQHVVYCNCLS